jgi:hypothetical protein
LKRFISEYYVMARAPKLPHDIGMARLILVFAALVALGARASETQLLRDGGFEQGTAVWEQVSSGGFPIILQDTESAHAGNWYAWLGGYESGTDSIYQDVTIPADASRVVLKFFYSIYAFETAPLPKDTMQIVVASVSTGATLATVATFTNLDATPGWLPSLEYDLSAFRGQAVRLKFTATNDATETTNFFIDDVSLAALYESNDPRLFNVSTRLRVLTGGDVMIAGLVVAGNTSKTIVVNVAGPSLANYGIASPLANPQLTLVRSSDNTVLAGNDDWQSAPNAGQIQASGFAPNHPLEPAIMMTLPPGAYTAIVQGANGGTGVALVGVFEVDHPEVPLINLSTRGRVLTGNDVMIAGFIIQGTGPRTVVVNVAGPSLANYGIASPLANPQITLVRSSDNAVIATNDDWQTQTNPSDASDIQASGFAPNHPLEPAIIATLAPGAYTAIVSGVNSGTGVALVGVFAKY